MIVWTERAASDFLGIVEWIAAEDPRGAENVADAIVVAISRLTPYPLSGREGRLPGTRELVVPRLPYIAVYTVETDRIAILRLLHGAQEWPAN